MEATVASIDWRLGETKRLLLQVQWEKCQTDKLNQFGTSKKKIKPTQPISVGMISSLNGWEAPMFIAIWALHVAFFQLIVNIEANKTAVKKPILSQIEIILL